MSTGQAIGSTDKRGRPQGPPAHLPARLRHALRQPRHRSRTRVPDRGGRMMALVDEAEPLAEVV